MTPIQMCSLTTCKWRFHFIKILNLKFKETPFNSAKWTLWILLNWEIKVDPHFYLSLKSEKQHQGLADKLKTALDLPYQILN